MKSSLLAVASVIALCASTSAFAADLPLYEPAPVVAVPSFTWTGFYVGANAGYIWGDHDITTNGNDPLTVGNVNARLRPPKLGVDGDGFTVGAQLGYNQQFGNFVAGVEADIAYTDTNASSRYSIGTPVGAVPAGIIRSQFKQELEYLGTVRGRLGFAADRFLIFGTGGLAYGDVKTTGTFFNNSATGGAVGFSGSKSGVEFGYALGGGVEYAITDNISIKSEYLYYDLGNTKVTVRATPVAPAGQTGYTSKFENDGHIVRAGVNYKF